MKTKILLGLLLLSSVQNNVFAAQAAAAGVSQKKQPSSLKDMCCETITSTYDMDIYASALTGKVPEQVINKVKKQHIAHAAALLWVQYSGINSPLELLNRHNPAFADLVTQQKITWTLSIQDLIDAGGRQILQRRNDNLDNLSLTSFNGLQNMPEVGVLENLSLEYNKIKTIESGTFKRLSALRYLTLRGNQITKIEPGAFEGLPSLTNLFLQNNQITKIERGIFNGLSTLQHLFLDNNPITTIEAGSFDGLPQHIRNNLNRQFDIQ